MKTFKFLIIAIISLAFNSLLGASVAHAAGYDPAAGAAVAVAGSAIYGASQYRAADEEAVLYVGLLKEIWLAQLIERFYAGFAWLSRGQTWMNMLTIM